MFMLIFILLSNARNVLSLAWIPAQTVMISQKLLRERIVSKLQSKTTERMHCSSYSQKLLRERFVCTVIVKNYWENAL